MTQAATRNLVPADIRRKLSAMLWRARLMALVRGLAIVSATLLAAVLAAVGADHFLMGYVERYVILYEWPVRLAVTISILGLALLATTLAVILPMVRKFSDSGIAQTIEEFHPELEERLSTTVELLASDDPEVIRGSAEMIGIVTEQARTGARELRLGGIVSWDRTARYWAVAILIGLAFAGFAHQWPGPFMLSLQRLFVANLERVGQTQLTIVGQGNRVVPDGEPLLIQAEATGQTVHSAWLLIRDKSDRIRTVEMAPTRDHADSFAHTIARARGTWRYQVRAGDSHTKWYTVTAVPRPEVLRLEVAVTPPAYSQRKSRRFPSMPDPLKVLRHSRIELTVHTNKSTATALLQFDNDRTVDLQSVRAEGHARGTTITALHATSFRVLLADQHNLDNLSPPKYRLRVTPDETPSVSILQPGRRVTLKARDALPIRFVARDDMAVSKAELLVTVGVADPIALPIDLPSGSRRDVEAETALDLAKIGAEHARQVSYRIRVSDSLPGTLDNGPQTAMSAEHEIMIDSAAQSFKLQVLKSVRKQFKSAIEEIAKLLEAAEKSSATLKTAGAKKEAYSPEHRTRTQQLRKTLRKAEKLASEIYELTSYTDYRKLGEMLATNIAKNHIAPAEQLVTQAGLLPDRHDQRSDRFGRAEFEIQRAREALTKLAKQFDDTAAFQETAQILADSAARHSELAERIKELAELDLDTASRSDQATTSTSQPLGSEQARAQPSGSTPPGKPTTQAAKDAAASAQNMVKLSKEQQELIKATQEIITQHPELWKPVLELQEKRSKTLLEKLADLIANQQALAALVKEQNARNSAKADRQKLAAAQKALRQEVAKLAADKAELLAQAGVKPPSTQAMESASTRVADERMNEAAKLQTGLTAELAAIAKATADMAAKLKKSVPDAKPHETRAELTRKLAKQATSLAQSQRDLAGHTGKAAKQRTDQQHSLQQADASLRKQTEALAKTQQASSKQAAALLEAIGKHARLPAELAGAIKKADLAGKSAKADQDLAKQRPDQAHPAQAATAKALDDITKAVRSAADNAKKRAKGLKLATDKWNTAEAKRQKSVKEYPARLAKQKSAMDNWRAAEAKRKNDLSKWLADQQARIKAATTMAAAKPATAKATAKSPATRPVMTMATAKSPATKPATTEVATNPPTTKPAASPAVAKTPPAPRPPKKLSTAVLKPKLAKLTKPADKPAPKPVPKKPLWTDDDHKSTDAIAKQATALAKQFKDLSAKTTKAAADLKQQQKQRKSHNDAANRQDGDILKRQNDLAKAASKLVERGTKALPDLKDLAGPLNPLPPMQDASKAIGKHDLPSVPKPQMTAAERLDAMAKALTADSAKSAATAAETKKAAQDISQQAKAQKDLSKLAHDIERKQDRLAAQSTKIAKRLAPLGPQLRDKIVDHLQRQQEDLSKETAALSDELAKPQQGVGVEMPAKPDPAAQSAAIQARTATEALKALSKAQATPDAKSTAPSPEEVAKAQATTADRLYKLAERLQEPLEEDPAQWERQAVEEYLRVQQAERAVDLADRQRLLARQLQHVTSGKPMQAVAIGQTQLRDKVADFALAAEFLAEQAEAMQPKIPTMKPKMLANATKAVELLEKATPQAMEQAASHLQADRPAQAAKPMAQAAKQLSQAKKLLGTLQAQFAKAAGATPAASPSDEQLSKQLTESLEDQYEALRRMLEARDASSDTPTDPAEAAAQAMRDKLRSLAARAAASANAARMQASAREFMEAAWEAAGEKDMPPPDKAVLVPGVPRGQGNWRIVIPDSTILDLELLGLTRTDWARMPDNLRQEVIQAAEEKAPAEYREVIKRYFKAISQQAGGTSGRRILEDPDKAAEKKRRKK